MYQHLPKFFAEDSDGNIELAQSFWTKVYPTLLMGAAVHQITHQPPSSGELEFNLMETPDPGKISLITSEAVGHIKVKCIDGIHTEIRPKFKRDIAILESLPKIEFTYLNRTLDIKTITGVVDWSLNSQDLLPPEYPQCAISTNWSNNYAPGQDLSYKDLTVRWQLLFLAMLELNKSSTPGSLAAETGLMLEKLLREVFITSFDPFINFINSPISYNAVIKKGIMDRVKSAGQDLNRGMFLSFDHQMPQVFYNDLNLQIFVDLTSPKWGTNLT